jgi:hypothetical protein
VLRHAMAILFGGSMLNIVELQGWISYVLRDSERSWTLAAFQDLTLCESLFWDEACFSKEPLEMLCSILLEIPSDPYMN